MNNGQYVIFQIKEGDAFQNLRQCPYEKLVTEHRKVYIANYIQTYVGTITDSDTPAIIFQKILQRLPADFKGRPIEVGDVVALKQGTAQSAYYVDNIGGAMNLIALTHFFTTEDNRTDQKESLSRSVKKSVAPVICPDPQPAETPPKPREMHGRALISDRVALFQAQMQHSHSTKAKAKHRAADYDL